MKNLHVVSIPLISGRRFYVKANKPLHWLSGFNPFDFRASFLSNKQHNFGDNRVSIPLISGRRFYTD